MGEMKSLEVVQLAGNPLKPALNQKYLQGLPSLLAFLQGIIHHYNRHHRHGAITTAPPLPSPYHHHHVIIPITCAHKDLQLSSLIDDDVIKMGDLKDEI